MRNLQLQLLCLFLVGIVSSTHKYLDQHGDEIEFNTSAESQINVSYGENDSINITYGNLAFKSRLQDLFRPHLIEHDFKSNEKAMRILQKQVVAFTHYHKHESLFIMYHFDEFDLDISIRIPHRLFEIDIESCDEKEQLEYYKNLATQRRERAMGKDVALKVNDINKSAIFTVHSYDEWKENYDALQEYYHCNWMNTWAMTTHLQSSAYLMKNATLHQFWKQHEIFVDPPGYDLIGQKGDLMVYVSKDVKQYNYISASYDSEQDEVTLAGFLILNTHANDWIKRQDYQPLIDQLADDVIIGRIENAFLSSEKYESETIVLYVEITHSSSHEHYAVNMYYKLMAEKDGILKLAYLFSAEFEQEFTKGQHSPHVAGDQSIRKLKKPTIRWSHIYCGYPKICGSGKHYLRTNQDFIKLLTFWSDPYPRLAVNYRLHAVTNYTDDY